MDASTNPVGKRVLLHFTRVAEWSDRDTLVTSHELDPPFLTSLIHPSETDLDYYAGLPDLATLFVVFGCAAGVWPGR